MAKKDNKTNKEKRHFFKDFKAEIKKVIWPTPKQLVNTTIAIIAIVVVVSAIVFVLDLGFDAANKYGLTRLHEEVQKIDTESNDSSDDSEESDASDSSEDASTSEESESTENE